MNQLPDSGADTMARPKGRPKTKTARPEAKTAPKPEPEAKPEAPARVTIINLKGSQEQADWMESVHRKTHIPKSVIVRLGLKAWAEQNGYPPFPASEEDR